MRAGRVRVLILGTRDRDCWTIAEHRIDDGLVLYMGLVLRSANGIVVLILGIE